ncbi:MAG TPA: RNA degradosome polyphosphate kinase [Candidatus Nitrosotenuis sp.]|nr:RNA degradosome polyphosphate kinase [Candidatus Nitrosotenuis sp.]
MVKLSKGKNSYINREESWLSFNERVLEIAKKNHYPLLERVRFLAIAANNLDEFYMVRLARLYQQLKDNDDDLSIDGLTAAQQLPNLHKRANQQMAEHVRTWRSLRRSLRKADIHVLSPSELSDKDKEWLENYFLNNVFPILTPMAIDASHPVPLIPCRGIAIAVQLQRSKESTPVYAFIPLPTQVNRFVRLPGHNARYIILEHIISFFLNHLFSNYTVLAQGIFRVIRDSEMEMDENGINFRFDFEQALKQRLHGDVVQLAVNARMPDYLRLYLAEQFDVDPNEMLVIDGILGINQIDQLIDPENEHLVFPPFTPRIPQRIKNHNYDLFDAIRIKDILIHHPYESFDVIIKFLRQAAKDPNVIAIKQTLYRTGSQSPIISALIEAAKSGKAVTALVEIKARFDEETNIKWTKDLEDAGIHVVYGVNGIKTHAKMTLVVRKEGDGMKSYAHFGTGNYNAKTAKIYSDLSLLTADPILCQDAASIFNYITGYTRIDNFQKISLSPFHLRKAIFDLINNEIENAKKGLPAQIWIKNNALTDKETIDALYLASQAGVEIKLVIRGMCCLRPGIPGLSDRISVKSIVGRFLEHSRIYCFANGQNLPHSTAKVYISSADIMPRNLDWRLEIMIPIENATVHQQILEQIMTCNFKDEANSWVLQPDGRFEAVKVNNGGFDTHDFFMHNFSLSGSGLGPYPVTPRLIKSEDNEREDES